jgi:hypothetical protein
MFNFVKVMFVTIVMSTFIYANSGELFDFKDGGAGGLVNDTAVYVYTDNKEMPKNSGDVKILTYILKSKVCKDEDVKSLVEKGLKIHYIYVGEESIAVIAIDNCN